MATVIASYAAQATLTGGTQDTVNLSHNTADYVEVSNFHATADLRATGNGENVTVAQTTDCFLIKAGMSKIIKTGNGPDVVKLISASAVPYAVEGVS